MNYASGVKGKVASGQHRKAKARADYCSLKAELGTETDTQSRLSSIKTVRVQIPE